jgi:uncharacterized protein YkwD
LWKLGNSVAVSLDCGKIQPSCQPVQRPKRQRRWTVNPERTGVTMLMRLATLTVAICLVGGQASNPDDAYRDAIHDKVNELRNKDGLLPLTRNAKLDAAAQKHAENMAKHDKYAHELDGKRCKDRVLLEGYEASVVAENVAQAPVGSNKTAASIVQAWRYSPGHYKNIMLDFMTETGVGVAKSKSGKWYYCQVFAAPKK